MKTTVENFVGVFEDAYPKDYCNSVIEYFEEAAKVGHTITRQQQGDLSIVKNDSQVYAHYETSIKDCAGLIEKFNTIFWTQIYPQYSEQYSALKQSGAHTNYCFKVQKTVIGGGYHTWHYESSTREASTRLLTWILYLNDVEEGGETEFLYYPKRIAPKAGTFILWPAAFTHTHRGNPPISNTKYIVTGWVEF